MYSIIFNILLILVEVKTIFKPFKRVSRGIRWLDSVKPLGLSKKHEGRKCIVQMLGMGAVTCKIIKVLPHEEAVRVKFPDNDPFAGVKWINPLLIKQIL